MDSGAESAASSITGLLQDYRGGNEQALVEVTAILHRELRRLAGAYMKAERPEHTLQPTALVNEAWIRLIGQRERMDWRNRAHFVAIAAQHMRQILVDHARRHRAVKRGGGAVVLPLEDASAVGTARSEDLIALDDALAQLERVDPRKAKAMVLRYFGGLEIAEVGEALGISPKTVEKDVRMGTAWLRAVLTGEAKG